MPKQEAPLHSLKNYIPPSALPIIIEYLEAYKVHLTITRARKSILGDYRHAFGTKNHRISVNGNLNPYSFLITLVHELAHLVTFIRHGNGIPSHGKEWKLVYRHLLQRFLSTEIFPVNVRQALERSLHNLPASSCADEELMRVLRQYDARSSNVVMVEQLKEGLFFKTTGGQLFRKGLKLRKRYQCVEVKTGRIYLFSPVYEVVPVLQENS